jgi:hypothetical protein
VSVLNDCNAMVAMMIVFTLQKNTMFFSTSNYKCVSSQLLAAYSERYFPILVQSCRRHNVQLDVLGWGQPWGLYDEVGFDERISCLAT